MSFLHHAGSGHEHDVVTTLQVGVRASPSADLVNKRGRVIEMFAPELA